ncbi:MAG: ABC transporter ATP-binding protein [Thermacetogeniaceae bacterium]
MHAFTKILKYLQPYRVAAILAPLLMILGVAADLSQPKLMQNVVDIGIVSRNLGYVIHSGELMIALALVSLGCGLGSIYFSTIASLGLSTDLRDELFTQIQSLSFKNLDQLNTGHLITVLTNDVTQIQTIVMMSLRILARVPMQIVGSVVLSVLISPRLSLIFFALVPSLMAVLLYLTRKAYPMFKQVQGRLDNLNTIVQENLSGIRLVKAFVRSDYEIDKFHRGNDDLTNTTVRASKTIALLMPFMMISMNLGVVAVIWFGGLQVIGGTLEVGKIMAFINYLLMLLFSLMMVAFILMFISRAQASADRIVNVLEARPDIMDKEQTVQQEIRGEVAFDHVTFGYNGRAEAPVLKDISFTARPGETVAILGATGSGKSSLVQLIPRLYDVLAGQILVDGIDVRDYRSEDLRRGIGICLQQAILFSGTVRDNIRFGRPEASDEEVIAAARVAQAHEFIDGLPDGYDTQLGQRGVNLSGGQKQRLAIARAILIKPRILILDDSTSAVDLTTESKIQQALSMVLQDTTRFVIAQRITSVLHADKIIVLNDGMIDSIGAHEQLMKTSEIYQDIYNSQLGEGELQYA